MSIVCNVIGIQVNIFYIVFEDNQSFIAVAELRNSLVRIKHITIKYHYFRSLVNKIIRIKYINIKL